MNEVKQTQQHILRAMVVNYAEGHAWDRLDSEACAKAADEIAALEAECERLRAELAAYKAISPYRIRRLKAVTKERDALAAEAQRLLAQRDKLAQILRDLVPGCKWRFMRPRIDQALQEVDGGN